MPSEEKISPRVALLNISKGRRNTVEKFKFQLFNAMHQDQIFNNAIKEELKEDTSVNRPVSSNQLDEEGKLPELDNSNDIQIENMDMGLKEDEESSEFNESSESRDMRDEFEGMTSPISRRKEITPELDELESEFFTAF